MPDVFVSVPQTHPFKKVDVHRSRKVIQEGAALPGNYLWCILSVFVYWSCGFAMYFGSGLQQSEVKFNWQVKPHTSKCDSYWVKIQVAGKIRHLEVQLLVGENSSGR